MPEEVTIDTILAQHMANKRAVRESIPPLPVVKGGFVEPPMIMTPVEIQADTNAVMDRLVGGLKLVGKGIAAPLTFAVEHLTRGQDVFQATVLTTFGRIPLKQYPGYVKNILNGTQRISGKEFMTLAIGQEKWEQLQHVNVIPGWTKELMTPEVHLGRRVKEKPVLSLAQVFGASVELFIDPFAVMSFIPRGFFKGATQFALVNKIGKAAAKAQLDPSTSIVTLPLRRMGSMIFSSRIPGIGPILLHGRDPVSMGLPVDYTDSYQLAAKALSDTGAHWGELFENLMLKYKPRKGIFGIGRREGLDEASQARVYDKIFENYKLKLSVQEQALVDEITEEVILPLHKRMVDMAYDSQKLPTTVRAGGRGPGLSTLSPRGVPRKVRRLVVMDPKRLLNQFVGAPKNFLTKPGGSEVNRKSLAQKMTATIGWKGIDGSMPFKASALHSSNKDPFHAVAQWVHQVENKLIMEERVRLVNGRWELKGLLIKYRPGAEGARRAADLAQGPGAAVIREIAKDKNKWDYFINKMHDITGNRAGRKELSIQNAVFDYLDGLAKNIDSPVRIKRIMAITMLGAAKATGRLTPQGDIRFPSIQNSVGYLTANTMMATLGLNLSSAIKNMSQLVNTAAVHGIPATLRGILRQADRWSEQGKTLKELRKSARFNNTFHQLVGDDVWTMLGRSKFDDFVMGPFNAVENHMRGITFNIKVGEMMKAKGLRTLADLDKGAVVKFRGGIPFTQTNSVIREMLEEGIKEAHKTNFIYGVAGRSQFMMGPVGRTAFALQSYSWKQAEFIASTWQRDGGAFLRLIGLNGWIIETLDRHRGINAENWLGWGFLPPSSLGRGPAQGALESLLRYSLASNEGNEREAERAMNSMRSSIREVFKLFGDPDAGIAIQGAMQNAAIAGLLPLPVVGVGRTFKMLNEFKTGIRETQTGRAWRHVTPDEAFKSWFFTTHQQMEDKRFKLMDQRARVQVSSVLNKRIKAYMRAAKGSDGTELMAAADELSKQILVQEPLTGTRAGLALPGGKVLGVQAISSGFRLNDSQLFWPHPGMIKSRLDNAMKGATVSEYVREMGRKDWLMDLYMSQYVNRGMAELDRGGIIALQDRR